MRRAARRRIPKTKSKLIKQWLVKLRKSRRKTKRSYQRIRFRQRVERKKAAVRRAARRLQARTPKEKKRRAGKPLKFSATQLEWDEKGGQQTLTVTNTTDVKQCMKIKSSDNKLFKVHPVYSTVDPGKSQEITVRRDAGPVKSDKIVIVTAPNKDDDDPEKFFEKADLKLAVSVVRQTGKGETKPDEEKPKEEK
ncbi:hypothetical protein V3C99_016442 [Haemonchus contortus]